MWYTQIPCVATILDSLDAEDRSIKCLSNASNYLPPDINHIAQVKTVV